MESLLSARKEGDQSEPDTGTWGAIQPQPFLNCPKLVALDLRLIDADDHQLGYEEAWNSLAEGSQLPQGLTYLRLPEAPIPAALGHLIEGLTDLRHLECQGTDYYPSRRHTNLQVLGVGGNSKFHTDNLHVFFQTALGGFSQLAKLDLELSLAGNLRPLGQLEALPSLRELDVTGRLQAGYAKPLLAPFVNLETLDLHLCCTEGNVDLKESFDCSSLRSLTVRGLPVNLAMFQAPGLTRLTLMALEAVRGLEEGRLSRTHIKKIYTCFTSLRRLELQGWREYDSIEELVCQDFLMLLDMMKPLGASHPPPLQCLKRVTTSFTRREHWELWGKVPARLCTRRLQNGEVEDIDDSRAVARVASGLLALPMLESLRCSGCNSECRGVKSVIAYNTSHGADVVKQPTAVGLVSVPSPHWRRVAEQCNKHALYERIRS